MSLWRQFCLALGLSRGRERVDHDGQRTSLLKVKARLMRVNAPAENVPKILTANYGLNGDDMNLELAERLISTLPAGLPGLFNPWRDHCLHDAPGNGPEAKLQRLAQHLDCDPICICVGEAPGYQGARYSGVAFTSERLLGEGLIPRVPSPMRRLSTRPLPFSEPSATIVWNALFELGIADRTLLWNALQLHPYKPDNVWSNRTPTGDEIAMGEPAMRLLVKAFPSAQIVAVGKKAEGLLTQMGIPLAATVRHPANGGAKAFAAGIRALVREFA